MLISFLTPTFNRAYILGQLYDSLCKQLKKDFEWIVVDDGSTDNTEQLVQAWKREAKFPIHYIKKENGGKHRALNRGIEFVNSPYTCIIDSDDYLTENAVELIEKWIRDIAEISACAGVSGVRKTPKGKIIGEYPARKLYVDAKNIERRKMHLEGDKAEVYRTDILRKYPFPEFKGEKFLSECAVWDKISLEGYWLRWYPDALFICEYREDGLTKTVNKEAENYQGYTYIICQQLLFESFFKKLGLIDQYDRVTQQRGGNEREVCRNLHISYFKLYLARKMKQLHRGIKKILGKDELRT